MTRIQWRLKKEHRVRKSDEDWKDYRVLAADSEADAVAQELTRNDNFSEYRPTPKPEQGKD